MIPLSPHPLPSTVARRGGAFVLTGVPYAEPPGARPLELDLYLPEPPTAGVPSGPGVPDRAGAGRAGVVFFHGGGWAEGSRRFVGPAYDDPTSPLVRLAEEGFVVASADYRLSGEAPWPAQLDDVLAAVRWLRERADELGLDPRRLATWGESAGGHLALMAGLLPGGLDGPQPGTPGGVAAVVAWYAPGDLAALVTQRGEDSASADTPEARLVGTPLPQGAERWRAASPTAYVTAAAPPTLLLHGALDGVVPAVQSEDLAASYGAVGAPAELHVYAGVDHCWLGPGARQRQVAADAVRRTADFLRRRLGAVS